MRLFIAVPLPVEIKTCLGEIIAQLRQHGGSIKWVKPENIHMTLRFLGDTDQKLIPDLKQLLDKVVSGKSAIQSSLGSCGAFPNLRRPRVFWVGLTNGIDQLGQMAADLEQGVRNLSFEPENKSFKPHLTLGRVRRDGGVGDVPCAIESYDVKPRIVTFDRLVLFQSTLTPQGPIYKRIHEAHLGVERFEG